MLPPFVFHVDNFLVFWGFARPTSIRARHGSSSSWGHAAFLSVLCWAMRMHFAMGMKHKRIVRAALGGLIAFSSCVVGAQEQPFSSRRAENADELSTAKKKARDARSAIELQRGADHYGADTKCGGEYIRIDREPDDLRRKSERHDADVGCQSETMRIDRAADNAIAAVNKQEADEAAAIAVVDKRDAEKDLEDAASDRIAEEERLKAERVARKAREAREAIEAAQHQRELKQIRASCLAIYIGTADKRVSDLTVRETQFVQACQGMGLYPPK